MTVARQPESVYYRRISAQLLPALIQLGVSYVPGVGPIAAPVVGTIAAPVVEKILNVTIEGESEVPEQLRILQENVRAVQETDYKTGIEHLKAAQHFASSAQQEKDERKRRETQQECLEEVKKAKDHFLKAQFQAQQDRFLVAVIAYYLGICWTILEWKDLAREQFDASYAAAKEYLEEKNQPAADALRRYQELAGRVDTWETVGSIAGRVGGMGVGAALGAAVGAVGVVIWPGTPIATAVGGAVYGRKLGIAMGERQRDKAKRRLDQLGREYNEEVAPPVRDLMNALKNLQTGAPPNIQFNPQFVEERLPT